MTGSEEELESRIVMIAEEILRSERIVAFTGAGISTESGIPDFRSPGGIWTRFDPEDFTIQRFLSSETSRKKQWKVLLEGGLFGVVEPNPAHLALARLEAFGKLDCIITQNIDNLHQLAGNRPDRVLELHGSLRQVRCLDCGRRFETERILQRLRAGVEIPDCEVCFGILKPDAVFFGESLPWDTMTAAIDHSRNCDLFIVIGSSLVVAPASHMPVHALDSGARLIIINVGDTSCDSRAHIRINGMAGSVMSRILERVSRRLCV
ncbi:MAG: NAD-dependent deacylase [Syntrophales bacterium]|jgi:NAD-dependent deacetylase|nr:NAD-dependent deacylase [Syntrophales bacterium]MCK9528370.1 NAD-dependent deacylase [Syntrophales bacterium]MDX9922705.1 NAD-dependent deacylase [Syntrophales bacterium]